MITAEATIEITRRDGTRETVSGPCTISDAGLTRIRDRMLADSTDPIGAGATIYAGAVKLGDMEAGYPQWNTTETAVEWKHAVYSVAAATTITNLGLYDGDRSATNPALFEFAVSNVTPDWTGQVLDSDRIQMTWRIHASLSLGTLNNEIPGSAVPDNALQPSEASSERFIAERVAGLANRTAIATLNLQFFVPNHTAMLPPIGEEDDPDGGGALDAVNAEQTFRDNTACPLISNIAGVAEGDHSIRYTFDYPARTSGSIFDLLRWYIAYVSGPFMLGAGEILAPLARTIGPAIDDVYVDVTFSNAT